MMNTKRIKIAIKEITDTCTGIKIFFVDDANNKLFDSDVENGVLESFRVEFVNYLKKQYSENDSFTVPNLSNSDDRKHALYYFDFEDNPFEFKYLDTVNTLPANKNIDQYQVKANGFSSIKAIVVRLKNKNGKVMSFYQYIHNFSLVTSGKGAFLTTHKTRVIKLDHDVLRLGFKFVVAKIGSDYLVENITALEKELGFDKVIHAKAVQYCSSLRNRDLVEDLDKFESRLDNETSFARKFVKIMKNSAVIEQNLSNDKIIEFAMKKPFYEERLKLSENKDKFDLNSLERCNNFLRLLDDEFLKSELTGQDYIARAKDRAG